MKKNLIYLAGALLSSAILTFGCSEDIPSYRELTVDKTDVFIQADGNNPTAEFNITDGNGNYKVSVADENIATAILDGNHITLNGLKNGTTTVTVTDWAKYSAVVNIKVKEDFELKLGKTELIMFLGENDNELVNIVSGNGGYQIESSDDEIATAELNAEGKISVTAKASGFCDITVTDADGNKTMLKVTVCEEHLVLEDIADKYWIAGKVTNIAITSGNGGYTVVSEHPEIATAEIADDAISVTGVSKGETNITVTDKMGSTVTFAINIIAGFEISTTNIDNIWISEELEIDITDGSGDYTIDTGSAITCTLSEDKTKLIVNGVNVAFAQSLKITDNIIEKTIEITVGEINYRFESYVTARWYVQGTYQNGIPYSTISTDGEREHIKVGTSLWRKNPANGYHISFEGGRGVGKKTSPSSLVKISAIAGESNICSITDLEIVKREYTNDSDEADGKGKFWIRFKEEGKTEYSYIITWF